VVPVRSHRRLAEGERPRARPPSARRVLRAPRIAPLQSLAQGFRIALMRYDEAAGRVRRARSPQCCGVRCS
jgi:hypothetical protein